MSNSVKCERIIDYYITLNLIPIWQYESVLNKCKIESGHRVVKAKVRYNMITKRAERFERKSRQYTH